LQLLTINIIIMKNKTSSNELFLRAIHRDETAFNKINNTLVNLFTVQNYFLKKATASSDDLLCQERLSKMNTLIDEVLAIKQGVEREIIEKKQITIE